MTPWLGYADSLGRVDEPSNLGAWSYEPVDTKLSRTAKPDHVIQLATYSKLIGNEQGRTPTEMHVELGNGERVSLRVSDFAHYHSIAQRRLETFANRPPEISVGEPCGHCRICRWSDNCEAQWDAADHLTLVANITRHPIRRLWEAGISTVRALAALPAVPRVPGIQSDTLSRLRHQATLQKAKRDTDANYVETLPLVEGRALPACHVLTLGTSSSIWRVRCSPRTAASNTSLGVLGYVAGFIQARCSRQRMCIFVSARLQATAAPDAPAPMISTSTGSFMPVFPSPGAACLDRLQRCNAACRWRA